MRKVLSTLLAFALAAAACGDDGVLEGSTTTAPVTTGASTTTVPTAPTDSGSTTTTTPPATTTSTTAAPTTTSTTLAPTTTIAPAPVTGDASLPGGARGRHLIPWDEVDGDWVLALYRGDLIVAPFDDGPAVLYLVDPDGDYYEITAWGTSARRPWTILDWSPDHRRALLRVWPDPPPNDETLVVIVDLATGDRDVAFSAPATTWEVDARFTKPTGRNVVVATDDGTIEHLEVRRAGGANAVLVDRPSQTEGIDWLYGQAGTTVVISDVDGIRIVDNQGGFLRTLDTPGFDCRVPRWWDGDRLLAACVPPAEWAAGNYYHQLWLVPDDGSAATPLTSVPGGIIVVDYGLVDARRAGGETVMQWMGDCSAASVQILQTDGSGVGIPSSYPVPVGGVELIGVQGSNLAVRYWDDCGQTQSWLGQIRLDGTFVRELVPKVTDRAGVVSAVGG